MSICYIPQTDVYNSDEVIDTLNLSTYSSKNLEEDLNYIRSALRAINGTNSWQNVPTNLANLLTRLNRFLDDFEIQHYSTEEGAGNVGEHKNTKVNGTLEVTGVSTLQNGFRSNGASRLNTYLSLNPASYTNYLDTSSSPAHYAKTHFRSYLGNRFYTIQYGQNVNNGVMFEYRNNTSVSVTALLRGNRFDVFVPSTFNQVHVPVLGLFTSSASNYFYSNAVLHGNTRFVGFVRNHSNVAGRSSLFVDNSNVFRVVSGKATSFVYTLGAGASFNAYELMRVGELSSSVGSISIARGVDVIEPIVARSGVIVPYATVPFSTTVGLLLSSETVVTTSESNVYPSEILTSPPIPLGQTALAFTETTPNDYLE